jgi:putative transposase
MRKSGFTDDQIVEILREHHAGLSAVDLCHKHDFSDATIYKWRAKYDDLDVTDAKKLKALEDESAWLKPIPA